MIQSFGFASKEFRMAVGGDVDGRSGHIVEAGQWAQDAALYCMLEIFYNKNNWKRFLREKVYKLLEMFFHLVSL